MIKKILLALVMTASTIAFANDSSETPKWEGLYGGGQIGYGWGSQTYQFIRDSAETSFNSHGMVGGLTFGYNLQDANVVYGIEADFSWAGITGNKLNSNGFNPPCTTPGEGCTANVKNFGTARARVGYDFNNIMPYVTGGIAFTRANGSADTGACGYVGSCSFNATSWSPVVGAGVEWLMTNSWSVKGEYIYIPLLGSSSMALPSNGTSQVNVSSMSYGAARVGINYHF